jgi:hypothetical protein
MTRRYQMSKSSLVPLLVLLVTCGLLPSRLAAQDNEVSAIVEVAEQPGQVRQVSSLSQGTDFTVRPSVYAGITRPEKLILDLRCINNATGQVIPASRGWCCPTGRR